MGVDVYTTPTCGYCHQVKSYLSQRGVPFSEHDVSQDRTAAMRMVQLTGQQGVPVVVIDGQAVVGFDRPQINRLLAQRSPKLGAAVADATRYAARRGLDLPAGAYVGRVEPQSAAALAGLCEGDVIVHLAGTAIKSSGDVDAAMRQVQSGSSADLVVWRLGRTYQLAVQF